MADRQGKTAAFGSCRLSLTRATFWSQCYSSYDRIDFYLAPIGSDIAGPQLVSVDHFRYELIAQLRSAAAQSATMVVVNSTELCRSIRNANHSTQACCEAMEAEIKPGDVVIEQRSGTGMTVRYLLPRKDG
jgi:hypothetical protein